MNKLWCFIILFVGCGACEGQNLVPNGDFEQYSGCPTSISQIDSCLFWMNPSTGGSNGSPDYYNQCTSSNASVPTNYGGFQQPQSGVGYCGIYLLNGAGSFGNHYREYVEVQLNSTLTSNNCYHFEMYVNLANRSKYTTDDIGIYFSDTLVAGINNFFPLPFTPQINNANANVFDTLNWTLVSGNYIANGNENYIIIGNFKDDLNTDTIFVNSSGTNGLYCYIEDVSLTLCTGINQQNKNVKINVYPNPVINKLNITVSSKEHAEIILYDITSRKLLQQTFSNSTSINTEQLSKGIYIYEVRNKNGVIKKGKVVKDE